MNKWGGGGGGWVVPEIINSRVQHSKQKSKEEEEIYSQLGQINLTQFG